MKRKNIIIIIALIVLIIGVLSFFIIKNIELEGRKYSIEQVKEYNYFVLKQDNKYGVIDKQGTIIVKPEYENVKIPNPSKDVFVCYLSESNKKKVINKNKEEIFTNYDNVDCITLKNIASSLMYEKSVLKYEKDGKCGIINFEGKELTSNVYDNIEGLKYKEGELQVTKEGKLGVINIKGNTLVDAKYDQIDVDDYYQEDDKYKSAGYIVGIKTDEGYRYGYIDINGKEILKTEYNEISRINDIKEKNNIYLISSKNGQYGLTKNENEIIKFEYQSIDYDKTNNLLIIEKSKKYGVSDIKGNIIVPVQYFQIDIAGSNLYVTDSTGNVTVLDNEGNKTEIDAKTSKINVGNGKYNIIITNSDKGTLYGVQNSNGDEIIKSDYTYIQYLFDKYFLVCNKQGKLGVLDDSSNEKTLMEYDTLQKIKNTNLIQASIISNKTTRIYSPNLEIICEMKNAIITVKEDYIKVYNDDEIKYYSTSGEELENKEVFKNNKLFAKKQEGKWGFVDKNDNVKVQCIYNKVTEFNEYGFAGIKLDNKWGVINQEGKIILEPKYEFSSNVEPDFMGEFYKVIYGFGEFYYTDKI